MKTNLNDQAQNEYRAYLKTRAMTEQLKPQLKSLAKEMKDLKDWTVTFGGDQRVMFMYYSHTARATKGQANLNEFVKIRAAIEAVFDIKLKTELQSFLGEGVEFIQAKGEMNPIPYRHGEFKPSVEIRMFGVDKCDIEYTEKTIKEPILTGFCAEVLE